MTQDISTLEFVAFDTETTGLSPHSETLVEIAAVRFQLERGATEYFQSLINPGRPIPPQATRVHGISDSMVEGAPALAQVLPLFFGFCGAAIPIAHNAPFDIGFLSVHAGRLGLALPASPVLDSCRLSRRVFPEQASHRLEALVQAFQLGENSFHRALADARSCMELFRRAIGQSCGPRAPWAELLARHGTPCSFQPQAPAAEAAGPEPDPALLSALQAAIDGKRSLWIRYDGFFSPRELTPHLLYARGSRRYMEATCHADGIRKNYRLDRIRGIVSPAAPADA